jgi:hypothetical protein
MIKAMSADDSAVHYARLIATDEFQAATFNCLHRFYGVAVNCLQCALFQFSQNGV